MSSSPSSSSSPSTSLLAPLTSISGGGVFFRFTRKWSRFNLICAMVFAGYAIFIAHLLRTTPFLALINLRQIPPPQPQPALSTVVVQPPPPPPLPLPPPYSVIKKDCESYWQPTACLEALASIPANKYARSSVEVAVITADEIYNTTVIVRSKMVEMLHNARENRKDHNKLQCTMLNQCVKMSDYILNYMDDDEDVYHGDTHGSLGSFFYTVGDHMTTCVREFDDESDYLDNGLYKPLQNAVSSVWDKIDGLAHGGYHIAESKGLMLLKMEELNPPPLLVILWRSRNVMPVPVPVPVVAEAPTPRGIFYYIEWWIRRAFASSN